jgi:catechol 2,3-dioxygenase-like lactoylglutathione lyase family enzyme
VAIQQEEKAMIDHIGIAVSDYAKSKIFYAKALAPFGIELIVEVQGWAGFGEHGKPEFWFGPDDRQQTPMHIAFRADSTKAVDDFYLAAIEAGATDNGGPGIREIYHPNYYGAFVKDPDGHNLEFVCHQANMT